MNSPGDPVLSDSAQAGDIPQEEPSALEKYGTDITEKAREGAYDPVIGREEIIERLIQILSRRTTNNPVLIGEREWEKLLWRRGLPRELPTQHSF